jgi:hypothetical protein
MYGVRGIAGDWRNYFDAQCIETFRSADAGRWNRLVVAMGYESGPDWR